MAIKETLYIYARVSTLEQVEKDLSLPRQKELGIQQAKELGMSHEIFIEAGESASQEDFNNRPQLLELLRLVKEGVVKYIFVFDQTRLSRNDLTKAVISDSLRKQGVTLYTRLKKYDFNNDEDRLTFKILEAIESYESSLRKARFQLGYITANKKGRYLKVMPPYGYKKDSNGFLVVDEEEKKVFLSIVDLYINKNYGTNQIANWLNENNFPTKSQKIYKNGYTLKQDVSNRRKSILKTVNKWNPGTINEMLKHELYTGQRKFKTGSNTYDFVECEPLISQATFDTIQNIRKANVITRKKEDKYFYLLKELLECGNCGQPMYGRIKPDRGEFTYRCNSKREAGATCKSRGLNIEKLNAMVWNAYIQSKHYHKQINKKIIEQLEDKNILESRLKELESKLKKLQVDERNIDSKKTALLKKSIDPRIKGVIYDEVMEELNNELKIIESNKLTCLTNLKMVTLEINNRVKEKSNIQKGWDLYKNAQKELAIISPPFDTTEKQQSVRKLLREVIKNIIVEYLPEKREHKIEIAFQDIGVKYTFMDKNPYKYLPGEKHKLSIKVNENISYRAPLISPEIEILNNQSASIKMKNKAENQVVKQTEKNKIGVLPTLHTQRHH